MTSWNCFSNGQTLRNDSTDVILVSEIMPHIRAANAIYLFQKQRLAIQEEIISEQEGEIEQQVIMYMECSEQRENLEQSLYLMDLRLDQHRKIEQELRRKNNWMAAGAGAFIVLSIYSLLQ